MPPPLSLSGMSRSINHQANWKLWPAANLLNFSLVPLKLRVLFANVVSVAWNMYMSQSANR